MCTRTIKVKGNASYGVVFFLREKLWKTNYERKGEVPSFLIYNQLENTHDFSRERFKSNKHTVLPCFERLLLGRGQYSAKERLSVFE